MLLHLRLITLHGVWSKSHKLGRQSHSKEGNKYRQDGGNPNQAEMTDSEGIQVIGIQAGIQV